MKGVLLVNLGSPKSPTPKDLKPYLEEFLMDERVIDFPKWLRTILVKGIILKTRPRRSAKAYKKIWWKEGSPLIVLSKKLRSIIEENSSIPISLSMRYGNPSIFEGLKELNEKGINEIFIVPLYPQFAMATTETINVLAEKIRKESFSHMKFTTLQPFYNNVDYIKALTNSITEFLNGKNWEHIIFSYHGIPERHIRKSDITSSHCKIDEKCCSSSSKAHQFCYRHQCYETTRNVAKLMNLKPENYTTTFQSRLPLDKWLRPYTDKTIESFAKNGTKNLAVVTPAFVSDCLETLEEIGIEAKEDFKKNGGNELHVIPCLNVREDWVNTLVNWIKYWHKTPKN